jgi:hypothetical protein
MARMKGCIAMAIALAGMARIGGLGLVGLVGLGALGACSTADDTNEGARGPCAQGGALTDCPDAERTAEGACWRLVDCGAISVSSDNENRFTWGRCVDLLERQTADRERLVINCVVASTCDELRVEGSPRNPNTGEMRCLRFGGL